MKNSKWLWLILLITALIICGCIVIASRGYSPIAEGWNITHSVNEESMNIRTETGIITDDYLGQFITINTLRQHLNIYIDDTLVLSSMDYGRTELQQARYGLRIAPEFIGKEIQIIFTSPHISDNLSMGDGFSFRRMNEGFPKLDNVLIIVFAVLGIITFSLSFTLRKNFNLVMFSVLNFMFAVFIAANSTVGFDLFQPHLLLWISYISFFVYALPMYVLVYLAIPAKWKKWLLILIIPAACYLTACIILNITRILPFALTESGYNYILSTLFMTVLLTLAFQKTESSKFIKIARLHSVLWSLWAVCAAVRVILLNMRVNADVEYKYLYGFTLLSLTFYGITVYAKWINELQKREYIMTVKSEYLLQNYEQTKFRVQEMNILKHELRNHLTVLNLFLKDEQYEEAQNYLDKYAHDVAEIIDFTHHENYLINVIAHDLLHRAKASDIKTELKLKAIPANIAELDLCSLLCNIVDNALEACAKMPKGQERLINLCITRREPYFVISCKNSNPGEITTEGNFFATKKTQNGHGYGLKIIERIVNSYDGIMSIDYDEDSFIIKVALKDEKNRN